jgi:hypothetical protein
MTYRALLEAIDFDWGFDGCSATAFLPLGFAPGESEIEECPKRRWIRPRQANHA